jgi:molybdopterin-guanine dinucleotide biosynthesis protein A
MTQPAPFANPIAPAPLGAILAGGASRRFGSPKALAAVGGRTIVERVRDSLASTVGRAVLITNEPELFAHLHLPSRADAHPGAGPVAGIEATLRWARDEGRPGALVAACDMPFLDARALRLLVDLAATSPSADAVAVGSGEEGARAPLCLYVSIACIAAVERVLAGDDRSVRALLASVSTAWVPMTEIARFRDPATMFFNVNTPDDLRRAEAMAGELDERT